MEPVGTVRDVGGPGRRALLPADRRAGGSGRTAWMVILAVGIAWAAGWTKALAQAAPNPNPRPGGPVKSPAIHESRTSPSPPGPKPGPVASTPTGHPSTPMPSRSSPRATPAPARDPAASPAPRFRIREDSGHCFVARLHGQYGGRTALIQPDGQLGFPSKLVPTDEPFVPLTAEALRRRLQAGPYSEYRVLPAPHY